MLFVCFGLNTYYAIDVILNPGLILKYRSDQGILLRITNVMAQLRVLGQGDIFAMW